MEQLDLSLNPFEFRAVTLSEPPRKGTTGPEVLIPLNSGQLLCRNTVYTLKGTDGLNPFEFRAVTLSLMKAKP